MRHRWVRVVLALLVALPLGNGVARAEINSTNIQAATGRLAQLNVIKGVGPGDFAVDREMTRAELATIMVRAYGQEANAALMNGAAAFPDTTNHWASGNIAMFKALVERQGGTVGMPNGTFAPEAKMTPAQAVAFLMKFLGVKPNTNLSWPQDHLEPAARLGLITADDAARLAPMMNANATRGLIFYLLDHAFYNYTLLSGKSFYRTFVDTQPPDLTVVPLPANTDAAEVALTGTVSGQESLVLAHGSQSTTLAVTAGDWSVTAPLSEGENVLTLRATDVVGNMTERNVRIVRQSPKPTSVQVDLPSSVAVGSVTAIGVTIRDQMGRVMAVPWQARVIGEVGKVDPAASTFEAGTKSGQGIVEVTVAGLESVTRPVTVLPGPIAALKISPEAVTAFVGGEPHRFTAQGVDAYGNLFPVDANRVKWSAWSEGAPGTQTITATLGEARGTATLTLHTRPTIAAANLYNTVWESVSRQVAAADADGDRLSYAASGLPPGVSIDAVTGVISGRLTGTGFYSASVSVTDEDGETATADFTWSVAPEPEPPPAISPNQAPTITGPTEITGGVDEVAFLDPIRVEDPDAGDGEVEVTISATEGYFSIWTIADLTLIDGDSVEHSPYMRFRGTLAAVNAALEQTSFRAANLGAFVTISVSDLGNTGSGGAQTTTIVIHFMVDGE